jgi:hypothetical protein
MRHTALVSVSPQDRVAWDRQVAALELEECDDAGSLVERWRFVEWANSARLERGLPALHTEGELHWRARALGLLD